MDHIEYLKQCVEKNASFIREAHDFIWAHPETGYREWKTSAYLEEKFEKLGYTLVRAGDIPGFYADLDTGREGPKVLIMGELDSLIVSDHPEADKATCAVHACGHSAQASALLGIAAALKEPNALEGMSGSIRLMAVPAEELIEIGYRNELKKAGKIKYLGGKVEFMYRGYMDGVDIAYLFHTAAFRDGLVFSAGKGSNGCITKQIEYQGKASHAGGAPQNGINALYAATLGMNAINALRETFADDQHIRVHPIITKGGDAVNAIPSSVMMESYVRGATMEQILNVNQRVNRALAAAAACMGANVHLTDRPGYFPLNNNPQLLEIAHEAMRAIVDETQISVTDHWGTGCTDMGDVSSVIPTVQPYTGGAIGAGHGNDYYVKDVDTACVKSAACQTVFAYLLLKDDAKEAKRIQQEAKTIFPNMDAYFAYMDRIDLEKQALVYQEDGRVLIDLPNE